MKDMFNIKCIKDKKDIRWNKVKNDDDGFTYKVKLMVDEKQKLVIPYVPGRYMDEDGYIEKKDELNKELEESIIMQDELIDRRIESLIETLNEIVFTLNFYGVELDGNIKGKK